MALTIYKQGQGYWVRLLSALGGGVLVLGAMDWLWGEFSTVSTNPIYFQATASLVVLVVFGTLLFKLIGTKPKTCDFLIATEGEMRKVNWPNQQQVKGSTTVVVGAVVGMAILLFIADFIFHKIMTWIGVLDV
ncbi:MAG: preprotein translocase subunit SecE [Planctomycetota bacterium]|jgi:preprotein translocase SecE subunit